MTNRFQLAAAVNGLILGLFVLIAQPLAGQQIRALNGDSFFSQANLTSNAQRLATGIPGHDVRITYVSNFVGVADRYEAYTAETIETFAQIPHRPGFTPSTAAETDAALNDAIDYALTTATNVTPNTVNIVFATSISLDAQGNQVYELRKYVDVGRDVSKPVMWKCRKVTVTPDFDPTWSPQYGDPYLTDYVTKLITAINDPNYIVTGSVRYANTVYWPGDTLFYFHQADELLTTPLAGYKEVELLVNQDDPTTLKDWTQVTGIPNARNILDAATANGTARLKLYPEHFNGQAELLVTLDDEAMPYHFVPVNLQLELDDFSLMEARNTRPITATFTNNGNPFTNYEGYEMRFRVLKQSGSGRVPDVPIKTRFFRNGAPTQNTWQYDPDVCELVRFEAKVYRGGTSQSPAREVDVRIKCAFIIEGLRATSTEAGNNNNVENRQAFGGLDPNNRRTDTLFILGEEVNPERVLEFAVFYENSIEPAINEYWGPETNDPNDVGAEGVWDFGVPTRDRTHFLSDYHHRDLFQTTYLEDAFPGPFTYDPNTNVMPTNAFPVSIDAFDQHEEVNVALVRKSEFRDTTDFGSILAIASNAQAFNDAPMLFQIANFIQSFNSDVRSAMNFIGIPDSLADPYLIPIVPELTASRRFFQEEDPNSRHYWRRQHRIYNVAKDFSFGPAQVGPLGRDFWIGRVGVDFTNIFEFDFSQTDRFNMREDQSTWTGLEPLYTVNIRDTMKLKAGFYTNPNHAPYYTVTISGEVEFPINFQINIDSDPSAVDPFTAQFSLLPNQLIVDLVLVAGNRDSSYNWTIFDDPIYIPLLQSRIDFQVWPRP